MNKKIAKITVGLIAVFSFAGYAKSVVFADTLNSTSSTPASNTTWTSGVQNGMLVQSGNTPESWWQGQFSMQALSHDSSSNQLAIAGQAPNQYTGDVIVDVVSADQTNPSDAPSDWSYTLSSINGSFSGTVVLPYSGKCEVFVGLPSISTDLTLQSGYAYLEVQNQQPSLSDVQMGLLQSWAVNYNESADIQQLAQKVTANQTTAYAKIESVSDYVSSHVAYDWNEVRRNHVTWQQATDVLRSQKGVCQDESFLVAAMLRSEGIPTQVIAGEGITAGSTESHEWVKAYNGTRWITFDPTWDQVYNSTASVALPTAVNHAYFDLKPTTFNQSHVQKSVDCW